MRYDTKRTLLFWHSVAGRRRAARAISRLSNRDRMTETLSSPPRSDPLRCPALHLMCACSQDSCFIPWKSSGSSPAGAPGQKPRSGRQMVCRTNGHCASFLPPQGQGRVRILLACRAPSAGPPLILPADQRRLCLPGPYFRSCSSRPAAPG